MNLSIVGAGFVGTAVYHGLSPYFDIKIYDKFIKGYSSLEETVTHSDVIFICVPTPMDDNGKQDLSAVTDAVIEINRVSNSRKILVTKSTVLPGTTRGLSDMFPQHGFVFNPEFLTERTAILDFINSYRIVLGGMEPDTDVLEKVYRTRFPHTLIFKTSWEAAEILKYACNCFFAAKVSIMNELYDVCQKTGVEYEEMRKMFLADQRIGNSHTMVPGFDGDRGFGGKCFPKDLKAFINWCKENNLPCDMFTAADRVNERVRKVRDWENIKGATTKNNYC